ncbi:uncharacterized protein LOC110242199 [Exaiptasia diaphana]|uniref:Uncharacterized protein n=1 Tax=Exaiptasia diaphana TaxID=2652724 RepID=A0A913XFY6_EXADI|nr:uncharacterized protein LOC110242199 [Exaiptasia diaphana]KXJ12419.1 hypothetical protein AC249_AIPGENE879 [Exaiptasia diaphana]
MSIARIGRSIACACSSCGSNAIRTITSTFVPHKNVTPEQSGFQGLSSGFLYDDKHGFGYNKDGDLVIVTPHATTFTKATTGYASDVETEALLQATKESYANIKEPVNDFRVPLSDSLSDDETEYFLNAAKNSYPTRNNGNKTK